MRGIFHRLTGRQPRKAERDEMELILVAPSSGIILPMEAIPDDIFSQGILGYCCGIMPVDGKIVSPADGTVTQVAPSGYAVNILSDYGVEILIHVGIDTIMMGGRGFSPQAAQGSRVRRGDLVLEADLEQIIAAGHTPVVITAVSNSNEFSKIELFSGTTVEQGAELMTLRRPKY